MNRESRPIPEPVAQLQRQLEQFSKRPAGRDQAAGIAVAGCGRTGPTTWCVSRRPSATAGLYPAKGTPRRLSDCPAAGSQAGIRGTGCAGPAQLEECVIEFESSGGSKMRIQWKTTVPPDWTILLRAWRETEG